MPESPRRPRDPSPDPGRPEALEPRPAPEEPPADGARRSGRWRPAEPGRPWTGPYPA